MSDHLPSVVKVPQIRLRKCDQLLQPSRIIKKYGQKKSTLQITNVIQNQRHHDEGQIVTHDNDQNVSFSSVKKTYKYRTLSVYSQRDNTNLSKKPLEIQDAIANYMRDYKNKCCDSGCTSQAMIRFKFKLKSEKWKLMNVCCERLPDRSLKRFNKISKKVTFKTLKKNNPSFRKKQKRKWKKNVTNACRHTINKLSGGSDIDKNSGSFTRTPKTDAVNIVENKAGRAQAIKARLKIRNNFERTKKGKISINWKSANSEIKGICKKEYKEQRRNGMLLHICGKPIPYLYNVTKLYPSNNVHRVGDQYFVVNSESPDKVLIKDCVINLDRLCQNKVEDWAKQSAISPVISDNQKNEKSNDATTPSTNWENMNKPHLSETTINDDLTKITKSYKMALIRTKKPKRGKWTWYYWNKIKKINGETEQVNRLHLKRTKSRQNLIVDESSNTTLNQIPSTVVKNPSPIMNRIAPGLRTLEKNIDTTIQNRWNLTNNNETMNAVEDLLTANENQSIKSVGRIDKSYRIKKKNIGNSCKIKNNKTSRNSTNLFFPNSNMNNNVLSSVEKESRWISAVNTISVGRNENQSHPVGNSTNSDLILKKKINNDGTTSEIKSISTGTKYKTKSNKLHLMRNKSSLESISSNASLNLSSAEIKSAQNVLNLSGNKKIILQSTINSEETNNHYRYASTKDDIERSEWTIKEDGSTLAEGENNPLSTNVNEKLADSNKMELNSYSSKPCSKSKKSRRNPIINDVIPKTTVNKNNLLSIISKNTIHSGLNGNNSKPNENKMEGNKILIKRERKMNAIINQSISRRKKPSKRIYSTLYAMKKIQRYKREKMRNAENWKNSETGSVTNLTLNNDKRKSFENESISYLIDKNANKSKNKNQSEKSVGLESPKENNDMNLVKSEIEQCLSVNEKSLNLSSKNHLRLTKNYVITNSNDGNIKNPAGIERNQASSGRKKNNGRKRIKKKKTNRPGKEKYCKRQRRSCQKAMGNIDITVMSDNGLNTLNKMDTNMISNKNHSTSIKNMNNLNLSKCEKGLNGIEIENQLIEANKSSAFSARINTNSKSLFSGNGNEKGHPYVLNNKTIPQNSTRKRKAWNLSCEEKSVGSSECIPIRSGRRTKRNVYKKVANKRRNSVSTKLKTASKRNVSFISSDEITLSKLKFTISRATRNSIRSQKKSAHASDTSNQYKTISAANIDSIAQKKSSDLSRNEQIQYSAENSFNFIKSDQSSIELLNELSLIDNENSSKWSSINIKDLLNPTTEKINSHTSLNVNTFEHSNDMPLTTNENYENSNMNEYNLNEYENNPLDNVMALNANDFLSNTTENVDLRSNENEKNSSSNTNTYNTDLNSTHMDTENDIISVEKEKSTNSIEDNQFLTMNGNTRGHNDSVKSIPDTNNFISFIIENNIVSSSIINDSDQNLEDDSESNCVNLLKIACKTDMTSTRSENGNPNLVGKVNNSHLMIDQDNLNTAGKDDENDGNSTKNKNHLNPDDNLNSTKNYNDSDSNKMEDFLVNLNLTKIVNDVNSSSRVEISLTERKNDSTYDNENGQYSTMVDKWANTEHCVTANLSSLLNSIDATNIADGIVYIPSNASANRTSGRDSRETLKKFNIKECHVVLSKCEIISNVCRKRTHNSEIDGGSSTKLFKNNDGSNSFSTVNSAESENGEHLTKNNSILDRHNLNSINNVNSSDSKQTKSKCSKNSAIFENDSCLSVDEESRNFTEIQCRNGTDLNVCKNKWTRGTNDPTKNKIIQCVMENGKTQNTIIKHGVTVLNDFSNCVCATTDDISVNTTISNTSFYSADQKVQNPNNEYASNSQQLLNKNKKNQMLAKGSFKCRHRLTGIRCECDISSTRNENCVNSSRDMDSSHLTIIESINGLTGIENSQDSSRNQNNLNSNQQNSSNSIQTINKNTFGSYFENCLKSKRVENKIRKGELRLEVVNLATHNGYLNSNLICTTTEIIHNSPDSNCTKLNIDGENMIVTNTNTINNEETRNSLNIQLCYSGRVYNGTVRLELLSDSTNMTNANNVESTLDPTAFNNIPLTSLDQNRDNSTDNTLKDCKVILSKSEMMEDLINKNRKWKHSEDVIVDIPNHLIKKFDHIEEPLSISDTPKKFANGYRRNKESNIQCVSKVRNETKRKRELVIPQKQCMDQSNFYTIESSPDNNIVLKFIRRKSSTSEKIGLRKASSTVPSTVTPIKTSLDSIKNKDDLICETSGIEPEIDLQHDFPEQLFQTNRDNFPLPPTGEDSKKIEDQPPVEVVKRISIFNTKQMDYDAILVDISDEESECKEKGSPKRRKALLRRKKRKVKPKDKRPKRDFYKIVTCAEVHANGEDQSIDNIKDPELERNATADNNFKMKLVLHKENPQQKPLDIPNNEDDSFSPKVQHFPSASYKKQSITDKNVTKKNIGDSSVNSDLNLAANFLEAQKEQDNTNNNTETAQCVNRGVSDECIQPFLNANISESMETQYIMKQLPIHKHHSGQRPDISSKSVIETSCGNKNNLDGVENPNRKPDSRDAIKGRIGGATDSFACPIIDKTNIIKYLNNTINVDFIQKTINDSVNLICNKQANNNTTQPIVCNISYNINVVGQLNDANIPSVFDDSNGNFKRVTVTSGNENDSTNGREMADDQREQSMQPRFLRKNIKFNPVLTNPKKTNFMATKAPALLKVQSNTVTK